MQLSEAVAEAVKSVRDIWHEASAATVTSVGQVIVGAVWSATVTVNWQVPIWFCPSVAVNITA